MGKRVAIIAVDPVNGFGLFQYLEAFFENDIQFRTFAVANTKVIKTNSGITITLDNVVANLKDYENEFDALVFACGDAIPKLNESINKQYNKDMFEVIQLFANNGRLLAGHCAASVLFDQSGVTSGKRMAVHPYGKEHIVNGIASDEKFVIDQNIYTAQSENDLWQLIPHLLKALK